MKSSILICFPLLLLHVGCRKAPKTDSEILFSEVVTKNMLQGDTLNRFYLINSIAKTGDEEMKQATYFNNGKKVIDGFWQLKNDTIFYMPRHLSEANCTYKFPIIIASQFGDFSNHVIYNDYDTQNSCGNLAPYYKNYFVRVDNVVRCVEDSLIFLTIYNCGKLEVREKGDIQNLNLDFVYAYFRENKTDCDYTEMIFSIKKGVLRIETTRHLRSLKLPI